MQDDPEAILRSRRPATRRTRGRSAEANTSNPNLPQTQDQSGPGHEAAQTGLPPRQPASENHVGNGAEHDPAGQGHSAPNDDDSAGQRTTGEDESITRDGTQADNAPLSTNAQEKNEKGGLSEAQPKEPPKGRDGHSGACEKHSLSDKEKEDSDPKRPRQSSTGAGRSKSRENADQRQVQTACERFQNSLKILRQAVPPRRVALESNFTPGNHLPAEALHQAIASVTEAISERGGVLFSLADRIVHQQPAARPGQTLLWAQHRHRSDANEGGHFSLFIITDGQGDQYSVEHRDSHNRTRNDNTLQPTWQMVRGLLLDNGALDWNRGGAQQLPDQAHVPAAQCTQTDSWTCGLYTIFNAWVHALSLPRPEQPRRPIPGFNTDACDLVKFAMEGNVDSATIRDFLECHNFIVPQTQIPADRSFQHTIALPSPEDLVQRVARVRLADELQQYRMANPGSHVPSIDDMLATIVSVGSGRGLQQINSIGDMIQEYRIAQEALQPANSLTQVNEDGADEAAAPRLQQEEYSTSPPPRERNQGNDHTSDAEIARQIQRRLDRATPPPPSPPANNELPQAPDQSQQEANRPSSETATGQGQQPAPEGEQSTGGQQQQASGNERLNEGPQANITPVAPETMDQPGGGGSSGGASDASGPDSNAENAGATDHPGAQSQQRNDQPRPNADQAAGNTNQAAWNANQPPGAAGNEDAEMEARRQRARALLYPENDHFAPGRPLRGPLPGHQAGIDDRVPDLSMFLSQYSDLARHSEIRKKYELEDKTRVFDQTGQNAPGPATQEQTQPAQPTQSAATGQQGPAAPAGSEAAPSGPEAPPSTEAPSGSATQSAPETPQAPTAPPAVSAPAGDVQPPAPTADQSTIPGLQGTTPPADATQPAATTDVAHPTASTTCAASLGSQSTLRSFDEDQHREEEAARLEAQRLEQEETRRRAFELNAAALREQQRMAREEADNFEREQAQQGSRESSASMVTPNNAHNRQSSSSTGVLDLDDRLQAYDPDDDWAWNTDGNQTRREEELFGRDPDPPAADEGEGEGEAK